MGGDRSQRGASWARVAVLVLLLLPTTIVSTRQAEAVSARTIAVGQHHSCAVTTSGGVQCWGRNTQGQLGDGTTTDRTIPVDVTDLTGRVVAVATGQLHTCAVTADGGMKCWGDNAYGQLGDGTTTARLTPVDVSGLTSGVMAIGAGREHTCAITTAGGAKCWGHNLQGQLGDGTIIQRLTPVDVSGLTSGVTAVAPGNNHTCALTSAGGVKCWGYNYYGQVGDGTMTNRSAPVDVTGLTSGVSAVTVGVESSCALRTTGGVECWGRNQYGQLGDGTTTDRHTPVAVSSLSSGTVAVGAGYNHTCAVLGTGALQCWGRNYEGQLGDGSLTDQSTPVAVTGLTSGVAAVAGGERHTCASTSDGGVRCWGYNGYGQLGDGTTLMRLAAVPVTGLTGGEGVAPAGVQKLAAGGAHNCIITPTAGLRCWGWNGEGQLGDGTAANRAAPVDVVGLTSGVAAVAAADSHTCAITLAGGVKCWGANDKGQLGDGTTTPRSTPTDVSGLTTGVVAVTAGFKHTCAITSAGGVKCWGWNVDGQLGDGTTLDRLTPVDVSGLTSGMASVAAGGYHTCGVTSAGGTMCWGHNLSGQLGDNSTTDRWSPVWVSGLTNGVASVAAGWVSTCALLTSGGVRCWGSNDYGQAGDGTTTDRLTPVDVSGLTNGVVAIGLQYNHACALTAAGAVKCWGRNYWGQVGDGTTTDRSTPVGVSGLTAGVRAVASGANHTCAMTARGGVECWGINNSSQLGDGTTTNRTTPGWVRGLTSGVGALDTGRRFSCRLTVAGGVQCWGYNGDGELGDGTTTARRTPVDVTGLASGAVAVVAGDSFACALTSVGGVKCWGDNSSGQLGDGTTTSRSTPVDVLGRTSGTVAIAAGEAFACGLTASGGVQCWGDNITGQLGDGTTTSRATPAWVSGLTAGVGAVVAGLCHACALTTWGGVKCWGGNGQGALGDGTTTTRTTPVWVSGLTSGVMAVVSGNQSVHTCALTAGGSVKCWGDNSDGQLGDGTTTNRLTPVDVSGLTSGVAAVGTGAYHTCALTTAGGVQCWGYNSDGQLGDGTQTLRTTPVNVSGLTSGAGVLAVDSFQSCAMTVLGGIKCWGNNEYGQLGDGTLTDRLTPMAVRGFVLEDDYDGDVKADVAVYRPSTGTWFSLDSSTNNTTVRYFGWGVQAQGDVPAPGDYDGDGLVDPTVFRPGTGTWFFLESSSLYTAYSYVGWGTSGDVPVPADYDGDGTTDVAVYRPSTGTWYVRPSSGTTQWSVVFGNATDVPMPGHYDSDGKADVAVYRASTGTWFVLTSASGYTDWWYRGWGIQAQGDTPAPGDYDGDGRIDLCVFRPGAGTWFILESHANFTTWQWFGWGASGDTVVPNDYDGDGAMDAAVYRPTTGTWYVRPSTGVTQWSVVFGQAGDVPLLKIR